MRKVFLTLAYLGLFVGGYCQTPGRLIYNGVDSCALEKEQVISRIKVYLASSLVSSDDFTVIGSGEIPITYRVLGSDEPGGTVEYTLVVRVKEGRYKYEFKDFKHFAAKEGYKSWGPVEVWMDGDYTKYQRKVFSSYLEQVDKYIKGEIERLKDAVSAEVSDW